MESFSKHEELKTANIKSDIGDIRFIPPVDIKKRKHYKKIPKLGEHTKKIKKEFM